MIIKNSEIKKYKSNLKRVRVSKGFTQQDIAVLSGINIKSIASYEQDPEKINKASVETVYQLADSLGCDMSDIIERKYL